MLGAMVVAMAGAGRAAAQSAPQAALDPQPRTLRLPDPLQSLAEAYPGLKIAPGTAPETSEFRPRPRAVWMRPQTDPSESAAPSLDATTAWQRLRDFRSRVGIRVLTLWETPGSTLSVQAGKHGGPSLQWSSRVVGRGDEASRGLLDRFVAATTGGMRRAVSSGELEHGTHPATHLPDGHLDAH